MLLAKRWILLNLRDHCPVGPAFALGKHMSRELKRLCCHHVVVYDAEL
jgi:hypothetical protein